jgi:pyridoxal phosphate enzyme (YggS family)
MVVSPAAGLVEEVRARVALAREAIAHAGGDPGRIRIVAVTKGFGPEQVAAAFAAGLRDFGENYADELLAKWPAVGGAATWHFLGAVQRNKVARLARFVDCWQSVTRVVEGEAISRHRSRVSALAGGEALRPASVLVEVDTTGLAGRRGCDLEQAPGIVRALLDGGCRVDGLMTVAPAGDAGRARAAFDRVARLGEELGLAELSMGMSGDLEQAVAAGATMVRLGTALFGPRPHPRRL